jgi:hypothetical protein
MPNRRIVIGSAVIGCACLIISASIGPILDYFCTQDTVLADLNAGNDRTITISAKSCWEIGRPIFYEVKDGGKIAFPKTFFNVDQGNHNSYSLVFAENKSLVGVLDASTAPPEAVIIYDFTSNMVWPKQYGQSGTQKWRSIFLRLQYDNPQLSIPAALKE